MKRVRALLMVLIGSLAAVALAASPADALGADLGLVSGSGVYYPGLGLLPSANAVNFAGNMIVVGTDGVATNYLCNFAGNEIGDIAESNGVLAGGCGPIALTSCVYVRVGFVEPIVCAQTGVQNKVAAAVLGWAPRQTPPSPVGEYTAAGYFAYLEVNSP